MLKKIFIVLIAYAVLFQTAFLLESCNKACGTKSGDAHLVQIQANLQRIIGVNVHSSSTQRDFQLQAQPASTAIRYDSLGLDLKHVHEIAQAEPLSGFTNTAYACSFITNYQTLSDFNIISSGTFDAAHPSGTDLTEIVNLHDSYAFIGISADEFINQQKPIGPAPVLITFKVAPAENSIHRFTIRYTLNDGSVVESSVGPVFIKK